MPVRPLSKELQAIASKELNEDPRRIQQDLKAIRDWAQAQPHISIRTDDQWILNFLRGCKFDLDVTKKKLDMLYTVKTHLPEFFNNRDPFLPEIQELLKLGTCLPLPKTATPGAPRVILVRAENIDPMKIKTDDGMKLILMIIEIVLNEDDNCVVAGGNLFVDCTGLTMNHLLQVPILIPRAYKCLKEGLGLKPQGVHVINLPPFGHTAYEMYNSQVEEHLLNMIHIYDENNDKTIYKEIPLSILPKEYGGTAGSIAELTDYWKKKVESYKGWFIEDSQYRADESKRPGGPLCPTDLFKSIPLLGKRVEVD